MKSVVIGDTLYLLYRKENRVIDVPVVDVFIRTGHSDEDWNGENVTVRCDDFPMKTITVPVNGFGKLLFWNYEDANKAFDEWMKKEE